MPNIYTAVALFSGGLDSILAVKVIEEQGLHVKCLHFISPFFGKPHKIRHWEAIYGIDIEPVDVSGDYVSMILNGPRYGFGKVLNPCVDCKILMMNKARELLPRYGAQFIISGEVLGQRPMSQRRDMLNVIRRDSDTKDLLLRPLCAKRLDPTPMEESGLVDRERLLGIAGRGRKIQYELAEKYEIKEIPTPAGGCMLAETESSKRYWPVLKHAPTPTGPDFVLANTGRQFWSGPHWLVIGRNQADNKTIEGLTTPSDLVFKVRGFPGPLALGRQFSGNLWPSDRVKEAAAFMASFSPKALNSGKPVEVTVTCGQETGTLTVRPDRETASAWVEPTWEEAKEEKPVQ